MINKDPVVLNNSLFEIDGEAVEYERLAFWADEFRHPDLLQYQSGDVKIMHTHNPETTTYELTVSYDGIPDMLTNYWETGERFSINVENDYFDLTVDNAWVADYDSDDGVVTIVAKVLRRSFAHVT